MAGKVKRHCLIVEHAIVVIVCEYRRYLANTFVPTVDNFAPEQAGYSCGEPFLPFNTEELEKCVQQ